MTARDDSSSPIAAGAPIVTAAAAAAGPPPVPSKVPLPATGPGADVPPTVPPGASDRVMLSGPQSRFQEFLMLARAMRDFLGGFRVLHFVGPCVTVFGSARFPESHPYYAIARAVGRRVVGLGFTVMTGGGPGLMEAANRGAQEAGGRSVGCNIELPHEQDANQYLDLVDSSCHYFFVRKVLLFKYSYAFIALPGGLGTLDELCEALTLIQTGKIRMFPVVLVGTVYWQPFVSLLRDMIAQGAVSAGDLDLLLVTDDLDEAMRHLEKNAVGAFGLKRVPWRAPRWWLGERGINGLPPGPWKSEKDPRA